MNDALRLKRMARSGFEGKPTRELLREVVTRLHDTGLFSDVNLESVIAELESEMSIVMDAPVILDDGYIPWVQEQKEQIEWRFWERYTDYIRQEGFMGPGPLARMDQLTDEILDRLGNPQESAWDKRGMVVGQVQSGKTANYIGLINKAIDSGYGLIIVLAGIHSSLRSQTQLRIDKSIVGFDTKKERVFREKNHWTGVGEITQYPVHSLTSSSLDGDFNKRTALSSGLSLHSKEPIILVVKKNTSVLKNLVLWLKAWVDQEYEDFSLITDKPLLIIDDEADNASINISRDDISKTNERIRMLTGLFQKSSYVGYTATPFANIYIQYDKNDALESTRMLAGDSFRMGADLFPKDFIINIKAPNNYVGPARYFGIDPDFAGGDNYDADLSEFLTHEVTDFSSFVPDRHKMGDELPDHLSESLQLAIQDFMLVCAARRCRGQIRVHNSMLIHVSRFVRWQDRIAELVADYAKTLSDAVRFSDSEVMRMFENRWNTSFKDVTTMVVDRIEYEDPLLTPLAWDKIKVELETAVKKIQVRAVHGLKDLSQLRHQNIDSLDYEDHSKSGLSVIAVGGNKLSRGLTLEGLSVSYYLRTSKMYDTLMQMGRWFGYRPGYLDLCRLYLSPDLNEWYKHITVASEEVRLEFDLMKWMRKSPKEFGLKVRAHPGVLQISSATKMRTATVMELSYSNRLIETYSFETSQDVLLDNQQALIRLVEQLDSDWVSSAQHHKWSTKKTNSILEFLQNYRTDQPNIHPEKVSEYVEKQIRLGYLQNWTVVLISSSKDRHPFRLEAGRGFDVGRTYRRNDPKRDESVETLPHYQLRKSRIISPSHEFLDMPKNDPRFARALEDAKMMALSEERNPPSIPSGVFIRKHRGSENALLLLYLLDSDAYSSFSHADQVVGYALSFPAIENEERVRYAANEVFRKGYFEESDEDEEEDE